MSGKQVPYGNLEAIGPRWLFHPEEIDGVIQRGRERDLERQSMRALDAALTPWTITWVDQRDDVGRDGFAQVFERAPNGTAIASPLTCALQAKATSTTLAGDFSVRLEVAHVKLWTAETASPVLILLWSAADGGIRARTAHSIRQELDRNRPNWAEQETVSIPFRREDGAESDAALRERLRENLLELGDQHGGRTRFHARRRRGLLLDVIMGTVNTSQTFTTRGTETGDEHILEVGPGWQAGEIDPSDVFAPRALGTALLLYEEVWIPFNALRVVLRAMTPPQLIRLLQRERIVPFATEQSIGFDYPKDGRRGNVTGFSLADPRARIMQTLDEIVGQGPGAAELRNLLGRRIEIFGPSFSSRVIDETKADLTRSGLRRLMGLTADPRGPGEPAWDARSVNRLVHLNVGMAVAEERAVDVVEYEAGLSRIAAEKWYSRLRFDRLFPSADALDHVLRSTGVPDLGTVEATIGMSAVLEVACSEAGGDFRDWFWEEAAPLVGSGARVDRVVTEFGRAAGIPASALAAATELKFRFLESVGGQYILGSTGRGASLGYAVRSGRGREALAQQARHQAQRRLQRIAELVGAVEQYDACPCGSGEKFRFCCGPKRGE